MPRVALVAVILVPLLLQPTPQPRTERTAKKLVTDTYHGVEVRDNYRWLEDASSPTVRAWVKDQNRASRAVLDNLQAREKIRDRLRALVKLQSPRYERLQRNAGRLFAMRDDVLMLLPSVEKPDAARVLVDPDELLPGKEAT